MGTQALGGARRGAALVGLSGWLAAVTCGPQHWDGSSSCGSSTRTANSGVSFLLASVLGTPGCEMRAIPHLAVLLTGRETREHFCPGFLRHIAARLMMVEERERAWARLDLVGW